VSGCPRPGTQRRSLLRRDGPQSPPSHYFFFLAFICVLCLSTGPSYVYFVQRVPTSRVASTSEPTLDATHPLPAQMTHGPANPPSFKHSSEQASSEPRTSRVGRESKIGDWGLGELLPWRWDSGTNEEILHQPRYDAHE
jgi:hypothetical protein